MLLTPDEVLIRKLPVICINFPETIDIELSDETGEIVVFEIIGEKSERELINVGDDETVSSLGPIDD
jgi:hypothetical protein